MKKTILLFDLFGVIAKHQSEHGKLALWKLSKAEPDDFWQVYWQLRAPYDSGQLAHEYWRNVAATLGVNYSFEEIQQLIAADVASWSEIDSEAVNFLQQLSKKNYQLALLSNIPEELAQHYEAHQPWLEYFSLRAFSCRIGHAKPHVEAYMWCCRNLNCDPQEVLFIDDREDNVAAAMSLGLQGHVFSSVMQLDEYLK